MAGTDRQRLALQTIFSFFLGMIVLAFVGVGVNTFYPSPSEDMAIREKQTKIELERNQLGNKKPQGELSQEDQQKMADLDKQESDLRLGIEGKMQTWTLWTSIIVLIFATVVMVISLVLSEPLRVLANGLLLGGLFTMIYGTGWAAFGGTSSVARFAVIVFALAITVGLGYLKFVRGKQAKAAVAAEGGGLGGLEDRVAALESRLDGLARVLSP